MKLSAETLLKQIASFKRKTFTPQVLMKKLGASPKEKKALTELLHQLVGARPACLRGGHLAGGVNDIIGHPVLVGQ